MKFRLFITLFDIRAKLIPAGPQSGPHRVRSLPGHGVRRSPGPNSDLTVTRPQTLSPGPRPRPQPAMAAGGGLPSGVSESPKQARTRASRARPSLAACLGPWPAVAGRGQARAWPKA